MSIDLSDLTGTLLTAVITYGPSLLALVLFIGGLGIPLPGAILLMAGARLSAKVCLKFKRRFPWPSLVSLLGT
ncbi:MAG: hypothetical protein R2932_16090 [Caldilineaceae bacterium]